MAIPAVLYWRPFFTMPANVICPMFQDHLRKVFLRKQEEALLNIIYQKYLGSGLSAIEEQKLKEIDNDLLWYDLKYLLNETPDTPKPVVHVPIQYRQYPFSQVEGEYRNLFDQLSAKICK